MENSVVCVTVHLNRQEQKVLERLENQRFSRSPDREFGTKCNKITQIVCK